MDQLIEKVYSHSVHTNITETLIQLGQIKERRSYDNELADEIIERAKYVLSYIQTKLKGTDPLLVSLTTLETLNQQIVQIQREINNFVANGNVGHLHNIDSHVMNLLLQQGTLVVPQNPDDLASLKDIITGYRRTFGQHMANATKQVETLNEKTGKSIEEVKKQVIDIVNQIGGIKNDTRAKIDEWDTNLSTIHADIEKILNTQKQIFEATLETSTTVLNTSIDNEVKKTNDKVANMLEIEKNRIDALWEHLEAKKKEVEELAGSVSISSMAGFYKTIADREKKSETLWKRISTGVFVLLISVTIFNAYISTGNFSWGSFAPKIPVSIAFASFLAFCLRQLTVHRKHERYNRQTQLELSALEPYITTLGPDVSKDIKSKLADKLFGRADQMISVSTADDKPEVISQEVLTLLDKLGAIVKGK